MTTSTFKEIGMGAIALAIYKKDMNGHLNLWRNRNGHHHGSYIYYIVLEQMAASTFEETGMDTTTAAIYTI